MLIDADLQDPPEVIAEMLKVWEQGFDVVYGMRAARVGETFMKKMTAKLFYRMLRAMTSIEIPLDTGDFRLMTRPVVEAVKRTQIKLPIVIRLTGTNEAEAREILKGVSGLTPATSMDEAVQKAVALAKSTGGAA